MSLFHLETTSFCLYRNGLSPLLAVLALENFKHSTKPLTNLCLPYVVKTCTIWNWSVIGHMADVTGRRRMLTALRQPDLTSIVLEARFCSAPVLLFSFELLNGQSKWHKGQRTQSLDSIEFTYPFCLRRYIETFSCM